MKQKKMAYNEKCRSISQLIATIYVEKNVNPGGITDILYGTRLDIDGNMTFVSDVPEYGQMCVHIPKNEISGIIHNSKIMIEDILEQKVKNELIKEEQKQKVLRNMNNEKNRSILPKYEGVFYETGSGIPTKHKNRKLTQRIKDMNLENMKVGEETEEVIQKICIGKCNRQGAQLEILNEREKYELALTLGLKKDSLKRIIADSKCKSIEAEVVSKLSIENKIFLNTKCSVAERQSLLLYLHEKSEIDQELDINEIFKQYMKETDSQIREKAKTQMKKGERENGNIYGA